MNKTVSVLHRVDALTREEFLARYEKAYAAPGDSPRPSVLHLPFATDALLANALETRIQPARCDGVTFEWADGTDAAPPLAPSDAIAKTETYRVDEVAHWDRLTDRPATGRSPGIKMLAFVRALPELSPAEFRERYLQHAEIAREQHPGIARYVQNFVTAIVNEEGPAVSAIAELHFANEADLTGRFYRDAEAPKIVANDVRRFTTYRGSWSILTTEIVAA